MFGLNNNHKQFSKYLFPYVMRYNVPPVSGLVFSTNEALTLMKGKVGRIRFY